MELLGLAEVATLLGVTKQVVANWKVRREGFPKPIADLKSGPVWSKQEILAWATAEGVEVNETVAENGSEPVNGSTARHAIVAALMNMKGGVGKSTIAANIGWWAAHRRDLRVLMIDLDPQFNLSQYMLGQRGYQQLLQEQAPTISALFDDARATRKRTAKNVIRSVREWADESCIHLVPASLELAWSMKYATDRPHIVRDYVEDLRSLYDLVLIDCPPTESILSTAAYLAADYVFVPVRPEFLSTIGLPLLLRSIREFKNTYKNEEPPQIGGIIFNDSGEKSEHERSRKYVCDVAVQHGWYVFQNELSHSDSYPAGARFGRPIYLTDNARYWKKEEFERVASELMEQIGL